jgi:hypothetical protein
MQICSGFYNIDCMIYSRFVSASMSTGSIPDCKEKLKRCSISCTNFSCSTSVLIYVLDEWRIEHVAVVFPSAILSCCTGVTVLHFSYHTMLRFYFFSASLARIITFINLICSGASRHAMITNLEAGTLV